VTTFLCNIFHLAYFLIFSFFDSLFSQSPKPCSHRIDKSSLNVFFNAPRCSLGLVACPIPGCNGRWGLTYTYLESKNPDQPPTPSKNVIAQIAQQGPSSSMMPNTNTATPAPISSRSRDIWWPFPRRFVNYNPGGGGNHPEDRANQWIRLQIPKCQVVYVDDFTGRVSEIFTGNLLVLIEYEDMTDPQDMRIYLQDERDRHLVKRIYIEKLLNTSRNQISFNGFITPYKAVSFQDSFPSHDKHGKWYRKNYYLMEMLGTPSNLYSENICDQHQVEAYRGNTNLMPHYSFLELCRQIAQYP
jgi:hypothetical protein